MLVVGRKLLGGGMRLLEEASTFTNRGMDKFDEILQGQIGIATSIEDPVAPARIIKEFNKKKLMT